MRHKEKIIFYNLCLEFISIETNGALPNSCRNLNHFLWKLDVLMVFKWKPVKKDSQFVNYHHVGIFPKFILGKSLVAFWSLTDFGDAIFAQGLNCNYVHVTRMSVRLSLHSSFSLILWYINLVFQRHALNCNCCINIKKNDFLIYVAFDGCLVMNVLEETNVSKTCI